MDDPPLRSRTIHIVDYLLGILHLSTWKNSIRKRQLNGRDIMVELLRHDPRVRRARHYSRIAIKEDSNFFFTRER